MIPCGVADGTDAWACMGNDAAKVKGVTALCSVNSGSLTCFDAIGTDSAGTSEFEGVCEEGEVELGAGGG